jgi:hypothetical protein
MIQSWKIVALALCAFAGPPPLRGQGAGAGVPREHSGWHRGAVHYGKWLASAGAAAFTVMAVNEHHKSSREWDQLLDICRADDANCVTGADGRYTYYPAELHYQHAIYYDHRARHRLLGGQVSLLTAAALFIADLRPEKGPGNIPFHAIEVAPRPGGDGINVGVRLAF